MSKKEICLRVLNILHEHLGCDINELIKHPNTTIVNDLGADSLDIVELALAIEEEFGIEFPTKLINLKLKEYKNNKNKDITVKNLCDIIYDILKVKESHGDEFSKKIETKVVQQW